MNEEFIPQGQGSGFIWDDKGHIVTNYHVIRGAANIKVTLIDQTTYPAKVMQLHNASSKALCGHGNSV